MNDVVSLNEYLEVNHNVLFKSNHMGHSMKEFCSNVFVSRSPHRINELITEPSWSLDIVLNHCKIVLIKSQRLENVLVSGYKSSSTAASKTNFNDNFLKSYQWRRLQSFVGNQIMSDIFLNCSGFFMHGNSFYQLFGDDLQKKFKTKKDQLKMFSLNSALYKNSGQIRYLNPIPSSKIELLQEIFNKGYTKLSLNRTVPPKLRGFSKITPKILVNHKNCKYEHIVNSICNEVKNESPNNLDLDSMVLKSEVMKFCTVIFEKLFCKEVYGSSENKSRIFSCLSQLIFGLKHHTISITDCMNGIKLKHIHWLGKTYEGNLNKQDFIKRYDLFQSFLIWLFDSFFPKLLSSFFHITHVSSSKELLFFTHRTWENISKSYIDKYISENLEKVNDFTSISQNIAFKQVQCQLRIMPKRKDDFRIVNVPAKGSTLTELFDYIGTLKDEIIPTRQILTRLRLQQNQQKKKVYSVGDIPLGLATFKNELMESYNKMPNLYFMKFDVSSCYDNIPQDKVESIISDMMSNTEHYHQTLVRHLELKSGNTINYKALKTSGSEIGDFFESFLRVPTVSNMGDVIVKSLVGRDVTNVVYSQLKNSSTKLGNCYYSRKKGIFQGLHLSSIFCDLVYDRFVEEKFKFLNDSESVLLRLADDFLLVSTSSDVISHSRNLVQEGFPDYGISINKLKTATNVSSQGQHDAAITELNYCGLTIDTILLDIWKDFDSVYRPYARSQKEAIEKIVSIFRLRLSHNTVNLSVNTFETVLKQIELIVSSISKSYCCLTRGKDLSLAEFVTFVRNIITETLINLRKTSTISFQETAVKLTILDTFKRELVRKNTNYKDHIQLLTKEISNLTGV